MKMKNNIILQFSRLLAALFLLLLPAGVLTGCSDDPDIEPDGVKLGKRVYGTLSVPLGNPVTEARSRSVDFSDEAEIKIDSYWIGIYDTYTGELVGCRDTVPRKTDGTRYTVKSTTPFVAEEIPIYYYDSHPEVYIVGVINYKDITARKQGGEEQLLETLLKEAENFSDLHDISINTASADKANPKESNGLSPKPLMMGYYTLSRTALHTTVSPDGSVSQDDIKIRLTSTDGNYAAMSLPEGAVRLQRLMAEINVNIFPGEGVTLNNVSYRVVNNPKEVFLEEHTTLMTLGTRTSKSDYLAETPNSADFLDDGYTSTGFSRAGYDSENNVYSFSYQYYENKHWGRSYNGNTNRPHAYREEMLSKPENPENPEGAVFRALCPTAEHAYNNNASYFILSAEVSTSDEEHSYQGTVRYIIHEGYACRPDGSASGNLYDFQRIRNTRYTYNVTINGLNDLMVNVTTSSMHNNGVSGQFWDNSVQVIEAKYPSSVPFTLTYDECRNFMWRYWEKKLDGSEINYGEWVRNSDNPNSFPWIYEGGDKLDTDESVYAALDDVIRFSEIYYDSNPMTLSEFLTKIRTNPGYYTFYIYFQNYEAEDRSQPEKNRRGFYMFLKGAADYDGCTRQGDRLIAFEQEAADLRNVVNLDIKPSYKQQYDINLSSISGYYTKYNNDYIYNYTPYFQKNYYEQYGYTENQCFWSGTKTTGAYLKFYDDGFGYRDRFKIEIYDPSDSYVELTLYATNAEHCIYNGHDAIYLVPVEGENLARLSAGYHTVVFTPDGNPDLYIPGESSTLPHALHILDNASWNFTEGMANSSETIATYFRDGLVNSGAYRVLGYGGLTVVGGRKFSGSNSYIQTGRPGFPYSTIEANKGGYFQLTVNKKGYIRVYAYHTGGTGSTRRLFLYKPKYMYGDEEKFSYYYYNTQVSQNPKEYIQVASQAVDGSYTNFANYTELYTGEVDDITDFLICSEENIYIQRIEFIPVY